MNVYRRSALSLLLAPLYLPAQDVNSVREWSAFVAWVKSIPPATYGNQSEWFAAYRAKMAANGMGPGDADALLARLEKHAANSPEWTAVNFNRAYSARKSGERYAAPNPFLVETVSTLPRGKALDLGMGNGRNSIFLAQQGWSVTGLDLSDVGVAQANERAQKLGVRIDARVQDVDVFDFGSGQWDLVCLLFFVLNERQQAMYQRVATSLKPGGLAIIEGLGLPIFDTLLQAGSRWQQTKLRPLILEYRGNLPESLKPKIDPAWASGRAEYGRLLLQKPA